MTRVGKMSQLTGQLVAKQALLQLYTHQISHEGLRIVTFHGPRAKSS